MKRFLPLLAALLLSLRPVCDVLAAPDARVDVNSKPRSTACESLYGAHSDEGTPCCANVDKDVVAKVSEPGAVRAGTSAIALVSAFVWVPARPESAALSERRKPPGALRILSYCARSTRILR